MIYLDNAATTLRKPPCVAQAVAAAMDSFGNSGRGAHEDSLAASRTIYDARERLARLFSCRPERVCFTCNSTEALNIAISGLLGACIVFHATYNLLISGEGAWKTAGYLFPSVLIALLFAGKLLLPKLKILFE